MVTMGRKKRQVMDWSICPNCLLFRDIEGSKYVLINFENRKSLEILGFVFQPYCISKFVDISACFLDDHFVAIKLLY